VTELILFHAISSLRKRPRAAEVAAGTEQFGVLKE
jgi:hypothetical protein